jgi:hypothetical protein
VKEPRAPVSVCFDHNPATRTVLAPKEAELVRWWMLVIGILSVGALPMSAAAQQDAFPSDLFSACTLESVAGTYGFNQELIAAAPTGEPGAGVGIFDLRPNGDFTLQFRVFLEEGGELITSFIYEGKWTVEENCLGFIDFPPTVSTLGPIIEIDFQFVAVENATELFLIRNTPLTELDAKLLFRR